MSTPAQTTQSFQPLRNSIPEAMRAPMSTAERLGILLAVMLVLYPPRMGFAITFNSADFFIAGYCLVALPTLIAFFSSRVFLAFLIFHVLAVILVPLYAQNLFFDFSRMIMQLVKNAVSVMFFFVPLLFFLRHPQALRSFVFVSVLISIALAAHGFLLAFVLGTERRATSIFENPNAFAAYLLFAYSVVLAAFVLGRQSMWRGVAVLTLMGGILATGSRGALLSAVTATVAVCLVQVVLAYRGKLARSGIATSIVGFAIPVLLLYVIYQVVSGGSGDIAVPTDTLALKRLSATMEGKGPGIEMRMFLWMTAWNLFESSPIFGVGMGQYEAYNNYIFRAPWNTHQTYLWYLTSTGLVGFGFVIALLVYIYQHVKRSVAQDPVLFGAGAFMVAMLTQAFVTNIDNFRIFWIGVAIVVATAHSRACSDQLKKILY